MGRNEKRRLALMILTLLVVMGVVFVFLSAGDSGLNTNEAKEYIADNHVQGHFGRKCRYCRLLELQVF